MIIEYRGFTIELECDGTWSVYRDALHYVSGNNIRVTDAEEVIDALLAGDIRRRFPGAAVFQAM